MRAGFFAVLLTEILWPSSVWAQTTLTLSVSANPTILGQPLTLTATLTPPDATGKVTFYDNVTVLGTRTINAGRAVFPTQFLQSGARSLKAYYLGDGTHPPASSPSVAENVVTAISNGFAGRQLAFNYPNAVVVGDFNSDGIADLAVGGNQSLTILLGSGDGTFRTLSAITFANTVPSMIAVGDFNLDGKIDIVFASQQNFVTVLLGNGDGTFQKPGQYSAGQQNVSIAIGDFNADGRPDLAVVGNLSNDVSILLGGGDGIFQPAMRYGTDSNPASVVIGDFNDDGKTDLAVTCLNYVDILLGNGNGSFQSPVNYTAGFGAASATVGDFNVDGKLDLAVVDSSYTDGVPEQDKLYVFLGNGDGTFRPGVVYATGDSPSTVLVNDFNGDGKPDLAVSNYQSKTVGIYLGKGDGTFVRAPDQSTASLLDYPVSIAAGDFDGNGAPDLVLVGSSNLELLLAANNPSFKLTFTQSGSAKQGDTGVNYTLSAENIGYTAFSGQVQLSYTMGTGLTVINTQAPGWTCTTNASGGSCSRSDSLPSGQGYPAVTLNVNVSASAPYRVSSSATLTPISPAGPAVAASAAVTILQTQTIAFPAIPNHAFGDPPFAINTSASSGLIVTVLSSGNCSILGSTVTIVSAGTCTLIATQAGSDYWAPAPTIQHTFSISGQSASVALNANTTSVQFGKPVILSATITPPRSLDRVTFFDGTTILGIMPVADGIAHLTTSILAPGKHSVRAYYGGMNSPTVSLTVNALGLNGFAEPYAVPAGTSGDTLAIGDFDGDGRADVVVANRRSSYLTVLLGNGDGSFHSTPSVYSGVSEADFVATADFNGDGFTDLIVIDFFGQFGIALGNGDGTFRSGIGYISFSKIQGSPWSLVIGDFNGDGKADLAFRNFDSSPNTINVVLGNGDGTFGTPVDIIVPEFPASLSIGDFNGDGKADLAVLGHTTVAILSGNGDGTFQPIITTPAGGGPADTSMVAADFNNDGKLDLAFTNQQVVGVLLGNGNGTFQPEQDYAVYLGESILVSDFNQDQKLDLVVTAQGSIIYLPGNGNGTFGSAITYSDPNPNMGIFTTASADFNGDGRPDLAIGDDNEAITILLGTTAPAIGITFSHTGTFAVGQSNSTFSITIQNTGLAATSGTVTVAGSFPWQLSIQSIAGSGWTCSLTSTTCSRSDSLAANSSYPPILVTVTPNFSGTVTSQVRISGGGAASISAADTLTITSTYLKFTAPPVNGIAGIPLPNVVVAMEDATGNLVAGSNLVSLGSSPSIVSTSSKAANGVATFSGLVFNIVGTYTLTAYGSGLTSATSGTFTISPRINVTVSGQVTVSGTPLSGVTINVNGTQTLSTTTDPSGNYAFVLAKGGNYTLSAAVAGYVFSAPVTFSNLSATQTATFTGTKIQNQVARAVLRDTYGAIQMTTYPSNVLSTAGGVFASDPSAAEDASGNVFVTAKDTYDAIWANVYNAATSIWAGWNFAGGVVQGLPSIAVDTSGTAWIASRDNYNAYWLVSYTSVGGFGAWTPLLGVFSTDPVSASCSDGSIYLVGKDNWNALWSGHYIPGSGFQGWQFGGGVIKEKPAATCGSDNALYIAAEDNWNSNWMARVSGNSWTGWFYGGAVTRLTPRIAALGNGSVAVVILDPSNAPWRTTFTEGAGNGWQPWSSPGGVLQDVSPAAVNGQLYFAGKTLNGDLWWWLQTGSQWTWIGNNGAAAGSLSATPR